MSKPVESKPKGKLIKLTETNLTFQRIGEDIHGKKVVDINGKEVGRVDALFIDDAVRKIRFFEISSGGVLGLGKRKFLLPTAAIEKFERDTVYIDQTEAKLAQSPTYDPDLMVGHDYLNTFNFYGYEPDTDIDFSIPADREFSPPWPKSTQAEKRMTRPLTMSNDFSDAAPLPLPEPVPVQTITKEQPTKAQSTKEQPRDNRPTDEHLNRFTSQLNDLEMQISQLKTQLPQQSKKHLLDLSLVGVGGLLSMVGLTLLHQPKTRKVGGIYLLGGGLTTLLMLLRLRSHNRSMITG